MSDIYAAYILLCAYLMNSISQDNDLIMLMSTTCISLLVLLLLLLLLLVKVYIYIFAYIQTKIGNHTCHRHIVSSRSGYTTHIHILIYLLYIHTYNAHIYVCMYVSYTHAYPCQCAP